MTYSLVRTAIAFGCFYLSYVLAEVLWQINPLWDFVFGAILLFVVDMMTIKYFRM